MFRTVTLLALAGCAAAYYGPNDPIGHTTANPPCGPVLGNIYEGGKAFLGIPFAEPPVGDLRWADAVPKANWTETRNATKESPGCIQQCDMAIGCPEVQSEDCLFLNVWASRSTRHTDKRPVLLFFPGGRFEKGTAGTALYDGRHFTNTTGAILVTTNYRLGVFGWLQLEDELDGNIGLRDQRLAMEWVARNIHAFGGNPAEVTIFGQSAGATSVAAHLVSEKSDALFKRAIIQSNPFTLLMKDPDQGTDTGKAVEKHAGCAGDGVKCLRKKSAQDILMAGIKAEGRLHLTAPLLSFYPWTPIVDGVELKEEPFRVLSEGRGPAKEVMLGTVSQEGVLFIYEAVSKRMPKIEYSLLIDYVFRSHAREAKKLYPHDDKDDRVSLSKLANDYILMCPTRKTARGLIGNETHPGSATYAYVFAHLPKNSPAVWHKTDPYCDDSVCHGDDLPFVFDSLWTANLNLTQAEEELAHDMIGYWGNFAATGDPNSGPVKNLPTWPLYNATNDNMLILDTPPHAQTDRLKEQCDFWDTTDYNY